MAKAGEILSVELYWVFIRSRHSWMWCCIALLCFYNIKYSKPEHYVFYCIFGVNDFLQPSECSFIKWRGVGCLKWMRGCLAFPFFFYSIEFPLAATSDCFQLKPFSGTKNIYLWILDSSHVLLIFHKFNVTILITTITIFNEKSDGLFGCWCLRFKRQALSQSVSQAASATVSFLHSISQ